MARRSRGQIRGGESPPQPSQLGCELSAASCGALVLRTVFAGQVIEGDRFGPGGHEVTACVRFSYGRSGTGTRIQGPEVAGKGSRSPRRAPNRQLGSRRGSHSEALWLKEAERRLRELRSGTVAGIPRRTSSGRLDRRFGEKASNSHPKAQAELISAARFFEGKSVNLGLTFIRTVLSSRARSHLHPCRHASSPPAGILAITAVMDRRPDDVLSRLGRPNQ